MNVCPYTNGNATCGLLSPEVDGTIAYCNQCSQFALRCAAGHWNRTFARYCTHCGQKLEKPAQWGMASGNPQRTATLPQMPSIDSLNHDGFGSWVANIPKIESGENLPGLLAIDGLIVVPNPREKRLDAYTIVNDSDQANLNWKWSISYNSKPTYGSTPIYHGLHLYSVVSGGIQKTSVIDDGKTELINNINGVDADQIEPIPACAPLKCEVNGKPTLIAGVKNGMLWFDFANDAGEYIQHTFFDEEKGPLSPTLCGSHVVFTSKWGGVLSFNINTYPFNRKSLFLENRSFSAPVSLNRLVYFEVLSNSGNRSLARFDPNSGQLSKAADLDHLPERDFESRQSLFIHPPLTNGKRVFLSDRSGQSVYTYDSNRGPLPIKQLQHGAGKHRFIPHQSIVISNRIYTAHSSGLTVWDLDKNWHAQPHSLAMGQPTNPRPLARPIRYGDKLFILCKDRLISRDY